jgi:hypothetical protein
MTYDRFLDLAGNWAAILTAVVAVFAYGNYRWDRRSKRRRLEEHLRREKRMGHDDGQRSIQHLMAYLGMSEKDVLEAAFASKVVERRTRRDDQGFASILLFEFDDGENETNRGRAGKSRF